MLNSTNLILLSYHRLGLEAKKEENLSEWFSQVSAHQFDLIVLFRYKSMSVWDLHLSI